MSTEPSITIHLRKHGHIPSFKNKKMLTKGKIITDPKKQKQMQAITQSLKYQLLYYFQTKGGVTPTGRLVPSWTPLLRQFAKQFDDSVQWIPKITIDVRQVEKGFEGADITISLLP